MGTPAGFLRRPGARTLATLRTSLVVPLVCLAFSAGVLIVAAVSGVSLETWSTSGFALGAAGGAGAVASALRRRRVPLVLASLCALGLGMVRAAAVLSDPTLPWSSAPAEMIEAIAVVDAPPQIRGPAAVVTARVERIDHPDGIALPSGRVQLTLALPAPEDGARIHIRGRVAPSDAGTLSGQRLLAQGISAIAWYPQVLVITRTTEEWPGNMLRALRSGIDAAIRRMLPEPHATLLAGLLLGSASGLPEDFAQALRASGTMHIVVVSGYNISLVAGALLTLFKRFRGFGVASAIVMVWAFVALSGWAPPSVRAALMGTAALLAIRTGRGTDALGALGLTSAFMLALDPRLVLDLGFQLSVAATLGLIALQPRVAALFPWLHPALREPLSGTIAAQLATLPLLAATFHQLSLIAPLSNLLAAPAIPLATIAGGIAVTIAGLLPVLSPVVGALLMIPTGYLVAVVEVTASIPGATTPVGDVSPAAAWVYLFALVAWAAAPTPEGRDLIARLRTRQTGRIAGAAIAALVGATIAGTAVASRDERPSLTLTVLNVGGGDAVFVRTPEGRTVLVDGGPSPASLLAQLGRRFGLVERDLSIAVLTTTDPGLLAGPAAAIERYSPQVAIAPQGAPSALYHRWLAAAGDRSLTATSGLTIDLEPGLALEVLPTRPAPISGRPNAAPEPSLAVRLVHGDRAFLIIHSPAAEVLRGLTQDGWPASADVIVTSGGGNDGGALVAESIAPAVAIIPDPPRGRERSSSGTLNIPGLAATYRTDVHGSVEVRSDGQHLTIRTERSGP